MTDTIQAQLAAARRQQILMAAARVFAEKGFHSTTIRDIARAADIADGTIYNYFDNKIALLTGLFEQMVAAAAAAGGLGASADTDLAGFLNAWVSQPLRTLEADNFELLRVILSESLINPDLQRLFREQVIGPTIALARPQLVDWIERGALHTLDIDLLLRALTGMIFGLMVEHILGDPLLRERWDDVPAFLTHLILHGIEGDTP